MTTQPEKTSTLAVVALVFSVLCAPIGLVLGIIALIRIGNSKGELGGKGVAIAAVIVPLAFVPIVGVLTAIAIPNFIRYQIRSKATEARLLLGAICTSEEAFRADTGQYARSESNPSSKPSKQREAWEKRPCPEACPKDPGACTELACVHYESDVPVYYRYACETKRSVDGAPPEFTCAAVGDLDGDGKQGAFIWGSANAPGATTIQAPIPRIAQAACTDPIPANQVHDCRPGVF
jgi:type IV pilus assembly protein PilA